jgi:hypothetical protein
LGSSRPRRPSERTNIRLTASPSFILWGQLLCRNAFLHSSGLGKRVLEGVLERFKTASEQSELPFPPFTIPFADHGNKGKKARESDRQESVKRFIRNYADEFGFPNPGRSNVTGEEIVEIKLNSDTEKKKMWNMYQAQAADDLEVCLSIF